VAPRGGKWPTSSAFMPQARAIAPFIQEPVFWRLGAPYYRATASEPEGGLVAQRPCSPVVHRFVDLRAASAMTSTAARRQSAVGRATFNTWFRSYAQIFIRRRLGQLGCQIAL
jgi:hypothetical protein